MFERFARDARSVVQAAHEEAQAVDETQIEAEHLLLALSRHPAIRKLGLDHDDLVDALIAEEEHSLAGVGIDRSLYDLEVSASRGRSARLGATAKLAIERALTLTAKRGQRRITTSNLLLGVISAEQGRVPRALRLAGIDVQDLRARL
jgi:ATP-dependent Clp protease ATP-binding subunit ClpA